MGSSKKKNGMSLYLVLLFGTAVFSMHFGGSCMLWPVTWGQQSGNQVFIAALGIMISGIILPFLGYLALARGEGSFYTLSSRISKKFALVFGGLTVAVLGPLFVIPRMSAASWDAICKIGGWNSDLMVPALIFTLVYYLFTYWFLFNLEDVLPKIGKILVPVLLVTITAVVWRSLANPMSDWMPKLYTESAFQYGFINGYQTMDLPAALIFGGIIIADLKARNFEGRKLSKGLLIIGGVSFAILTCSHLLQMLVGANTGDLFVNVAYAKLYATIILNLWGVAGGVVFNIALLLAALTSAVGLSAGTATFFEEATDKKWPYRNCAIATLVVSALISPIGLTKIISFTAPVLSLIYPPCIALVLGYVILRNNYLGTIGGATMLAFGWGCIDALIGYLALFNLDSTGIITVYNLMPFTEIGLGWLLPTLLGAGVGYFLIDKKRRFVNNIQSNSST